jgi:hypothetical protein
MKGGELSPDDIRLLSHSRDFQLGKRAGPAHEYESRITLAGGGDPTFHIDFPDFLRTVASSVECVRILTGGLSPALDLDQLEAVLREVRDNSGNIHAEVSFHPYGYLHGDGRIRETLLALSRLPLAQLSLKILHTADWLDTPPEARSQLSYLSPSDAYTTSLFSWVRANFSTFEDGRRALSSSSPKQESKPFLDVRTSPTFLRNTGRARDLHGALTSGMTTPKKVHAFLNAVKHGVFNDMHMTADGHLTACFAADFGRPELYEGDLRGHSFEEIVANRALLVSHYVRECEVWLRSRQNSEHGSICDTVCKRAREAFVSDPRRIPSHRGSGETVLPVRQKLVVTR